VTAGNPYNANVESQKTLEVLQAIAERSVASTLTGEAARRLSCALRDELDVDITAAEIQVAGSIVALTNVVESRLAKAPNGRTLIEIYSELERLIREELSHNVNYHWYAAWMGDLLNETDSLEDVEIVIRMEETFGFSIPDKDVQQMRTLGETVRYLWRRSCDRLSVI
jgi:acyl carrier protein